MHASASLFRTAGGTHAGAIAWSTVLYGGVAIAATDFLYCLLYWVPQGVSPLRLWQGIAAGALGRAAFHDGVASALLGAGFQWLIGSAFVFAYALAALWRPRLQLSINAHGVGYGLFLYAVMNGVVVPLSAAPHPAHPQVAWMLISVPMFAVFGVIAARFAVHALQPGTRNVE
ncbi:hypothetical protein [Lysobacter terrae]